MEWGCDMTEAVSWSESAAFSVSTLCYWTLYWLKERWSWPIWSDSFYSSSPWKSLLFCIIKFEVTRLSIVADFWFWCELCSENYSCYWSSIRTFWCTLYVTVWRPDRGLLFSIITSIDDKVSYGWTPSNWGNSGYWLLASSCEISASSCSASSSSSFFRSSKDAL